MYLTLVAKLYNRFLPYYLISLRQNHIKNKMVTAIFKASKFIDIIFNYC